MKIDWSKLNPFQATEADIINNKKAGMVYVADFGNGSGKYISIAEYGTPGVDADIKVSPRIYLRLTYLQNEDGGKISGVEIAKVNGDKIERVHFSTLDFERILQLLRVFSELDLKSVANRSILLEESIIGDAKEMQRFLNLIATDPLGQSKITEIAKNLGLIDVQGIREGERIGTHAEKKNPTDFALWKFSPSDHKREQEWPSPWGVGFPGWHIECSAMSKALLGTTFDIHTGGIDHIPVHHNNEIAQSESAHDKEFVHYWLHSAFVTIEGSKMAKSEGNFLTLQSIKEKNISPLAYRYFLLSARYSTPLNFTWEALEAAQTAYKRMNSNVAELPNGGRARTDLVQKALSFISDDLDTPKALALVWDILKDDTLSPADKKATIVKIDALLGLLTKEQEKASVIPPAVQALALERQNARVQKDWKKSDELRDKIKAEGFEIKDTPHGYTLTQL
jgi:hypothetical protein